MCEVVVKSVGSVPGAGWKRDVLAGGPSGDRIDLPAIQRRSSVKHRGVRGRRIRPHVVGLCRSEAAVFQQAVGRPTPALAVCGRPEPGSRSGKLGACGRSRAVGSFGWAVAGGCHGACSGSSSPALNVSRHLVFAWGAAVDLIDAATYPSEISHHDCRGAFHSRTMKRSSLSTKSGSVPLWRRIESMIRLRTPIP